MNNKKLGTFPGRFHYPSAGWVSSKLLHKYIVVCWQHERHGNEICGKNTIALHTEGKFFNTHGNRDLVIFAL